MSSFQAINSFTELLDLLKNSRAHGNRQYAYSQLAESLGFKSPRTLAMVHRGVRNPSANLTLKICKYLKSGPKEQEYIQLLAAKTIAARKGRETEEIEAKLQRLRRFFEYKNTQKNKLNNDPIDRKLTLDSQRRKMMFALSSLNFTQGRQNFLNFNLFLSDEKYELVQQKISELQFELCEDFSLVNSKSVENYKHYEVIMQIFESSIK